MATVSSTVGLDKKSSLSGSSAMRSSLRHSQPPRPSSPQTPTTHHHSRSAISSFASTSSPGSSFRNEEEAVILEFGSRWLRAGFEGDSTPMCLVGFGPEQSRKAGDYRGWIRTGDDSDSGRNNRRIKKAEDWTREYELWRMDLRDLDLGLVEDKIERAIREIYNTYLLSDAGSSRLVLVLPSVMPHPLLAVILSTLFNRWRYPSITLLPSATMAVVAAGLRSGLVVDIGWAETTVTGIYEYREIETKRSTRAMKLLMQEMGRFLSTLDNNNSNNNNNNNDVQETTADGISVRFEYCEEVVSRLAWCRLGDEEEDEITPTASDQQPSPYSEEEEGLTGAIPRRRFHASPSRRTVSIPSPSNSAVYVDVPFLSFAEPVEQTLLAEGIPDLELDDHDQPIHKVVYKTLLALPPDVRGACMSRIVFIGGGSNIPGIRRRVMKDVAAMVEKYGWSPVRGRVIEEQRKKLQELSINRQSQPQPSPQPSANDGNSSSSSTEANTTPEPPNDQDEREEQKEEQQEEEEEEEEEEKEKEEKEEEIDFVEQKLRRNNPNRDAKPYVHGVFRQVESLGAWAGASLVTSLKVRGLVEIEREKYLQHGLAGASRDFEFHASGGGGGGHGGGAGDRRSGFGHHHAGGSGRAAGDRSSWTLAGWG
ncbi:putative actin-related protein RO7 [Thermoascus aurantiacus ATCC 26904]